MKALRTIFVTAAMSTSLLAVAESYLVTTSGSGRGISQSFACSAAAKDAVNDAKWECSGYGSGFQLRSYYAMTCYCTRQGGSHICTTSGRGTCSDGRRR